MVDNQTSHDDYIYQKVIMLYWLNDNLSSQMTRASQFIIGIDKYRTLHCSMDHPA
jgi:hypothetical protein